MKMMSMYRCAVCGVVVGAVGGCLEAEPTEAIEEIASASRCSDDWPVFSYDHANTNANTSEDEIGYRNAPSLRRVWETFNDDAATPAAPPAGFVLESVLGLVFPKAVVGVVSPPIVVDGTIYYVDELGTIFARDARSGRATRSSHWTTTLVDPDYDSGTPAVAPDLYYSPIVAEGDYLWIQSSFYGRLHAVRRSTGAEVDFDPSTPGTQPFAVLPDQIFASNLGMAVSVRDRDRTLLVTEVNVILNDALVGAAEVGHVVAIDITNPRAPFEAWRRATIDVNPSTGLRYGAGVSAGSGLAVDEARHLVIGGTGQNTVSPYAGYPDPADTPAP
jgi:outer membrane protein assembly factor BamB